MALLDKDLPAAQITTPAINAKVITPSDSDLVNFTRAIIIGGAGNLVFRVPGDLGDIGDITLPVVAGQTIPVVATQIRAATTATSIVVLF